jgi:hypothetical protein
VADGQERHERPGTERPIRTSRNGEKRNHCIKAKAGASIGFSPWIDTRIPGFRRLIGHHLKMHCMVRTNAMKDAALAASQPQAITTGPVLTRLLRTPRL